MMKNHIAIFIVILLLGGFIYLNSLSGTLQWDDIPHIANNQSLYRWDNPIRIFHYWPTRFVLFWTLSLNYHFGGINPFGYHLVNTIIHIFSAFMVYLIFMNLTSGKENYFGRALDLKRSLAFFAGMIFLSHPLQTQAVTYIIQRGASLSGLFCLISLYFYIRGRREKPYINLILAWVSGLLGIFSKEGAAALPILLLIWELILGPRERWSRKLIALLPFFLLPLLLIGVIVWGARTGDSGFYYKMNLQLTPPALGMIDSKTPVLSRLDYLITQINVIRIYLRLLFIPARQTHYYGQSVATSIFQNISIFSLMLLLTCFAVAARAARSAKIVSFGIFFFYAALLPTSSVFILWPLISEHHLYLSLAGFAWTFSSGLELILNRKRFKAFGTLIILCLALMAYTRNFVWLSPYTLWGDALRKNPRLASLHDAMATGYNRSGKFEEARRESLKALELNPGYNAYQNLWASYHNMGMHGEAEETAVRWIELFPGEALAHQSLGITLMRIGVDNAAENELRMAIAMDSKLIRPHELLGIIYRQRGEYERSGEELRAVIRAAPYKMAGYEELGKTYETEKKWKKAVEIYRESLRFNPNHIIARIRLVFLYQRLGEENASQIELEKIEVLVGNPDLINSIREELAVGK